MQTLAEKLGTTPHVSAVLQKAKRWGLDSPALLESLGVTRGCWHYRSPEIVSLPHVSESDFSNEELAVALLSPCLPYSPHTIRIGAAMLGATDNQIPVLTHLAVAEECVAQMRYIAQAALLFEPQSPYWRELLNGLPMTPPIREGVMPHPTRFVSMTGMTRAGMQRVAVWNRPRADLALTRG